MLPGWLGTRAILLEGKLLQTAAEHAGRDYCLHDPLCANCGLCTRGTHTLDFICDHALCSGEKACLMAVSLSGSFLRCSCFLCLAFRSFGARSDVRVLACFPPVVFRFASNLLLV